MKRTLLAVLGTFLLLILGVLGTLWAMDQTTDAYGLARNAAQEREAALQQVREAERQVLPVRRVTVLVIR